MHEMSLFSGLLKKLDDIARAEGARKILKVRVFIGALAHISGPHFREHFEAGTRGSVAEGAELEIEVSDDADDPRAQDIVLLSVDVDT
jgi:hydrogenase nickel incorporation protein HypA/HybF